jgi:predicted DNA-binding transcriptional regulator YafY
MRYQGQTGEEREREFDCYGLVYHGERWYAVGYCHLRRDVRVFRLDRISAIEPREARFLPPERFDCLAFAIQSFAAIPSRWLAEALLQTTLERVRDAVPAAFATLEETAEGVLLRAYDDDLAHTARFLVGLGCPFRVLGPPELVEAVRALARSLLAMTEAETGER